MQSQLMLDNSMMIQILLERLKNGIVDNEEMQRELMDNNIQRYIKMKEMIQLTGKSKSTLWRMYAKRNEFPKPQKTKGGTFLGWPENIYKEWVESDKKFN